MTTETTNTIGRTPGRAVAEALAAWRRFWFAPIDPASLCLIRIGVGAVLLFVYATWGPETLEILADDGWVDAQAIQELSTPDEEGVVYLDRWTPSAWFLVPNRTASACLYGVLLMAAGCYAIGFATRVSNLIVLALHLSVVHRAIIYSYGVDSVLSLLLLYTLLAPVGARYSVDAWLRRRRQPGLGVTPSSAARLATRCIQLHLCVIYLSSGLSKLQGRTWWDGTAVWDVMMSHEIHFFDMRWIAQMGEFNTTVFSLLATGFTLAYEIGFPLLIWNRRLRPALLLSGIALHGGIATTMGLWSFGATMMIACWSFLPPEGVERTMARLRGRSASPHGSCEPLAPVSAAA